MLRSVAAKTLRDLRRGFLWWSVGLAGMVALMVAVYPTVRDNPALNKFVEQYPDTLKAFIGFGGPVDYTSAAGYLGSELFSFMVPLLLLLAAIGAGARAVAGEEEAGTLELLLSCPVSRRRLVLEKLAALVVETVALGVVLVASLWVGARAVSMDVSLAHLAAATASAVILALAYGAIALLVGAATGRRALTDRRRRSSRSRRLPRRLARAARRRPRRGEGSVALLPLLRQRPAPPRPRRRARAAAARARRRRRPPRPLRPRAPRRRGRLKTSAVRTTETDSVRLSLRDVG